jgi:hypothetical protein
VGLVVRGEVGLLCGCTFLDQGGEEGEQKVRHSSKGAEILYKFFHDTYMLKNVHGNPLLREGEEIDVGQQAQAYANVEIIMARLADEGVIMVRDNYEPIPHDKWEPGDLVVNVRTGATAKTYFRKSWPDDEPFPGWWVEGDGGIADFATDWRSLKCLLAERKHFGL